MKINLRLWLFLWLVFTVLVIAQTRIYAQTAFTTGRGSWQEVPLKNETLKETGTEKPKQTIEKPRPLEDRDAPEMLPQTTALPKTDKTDQPNIHVDLGSELGSDSGSDLDQSLPNRDPDLTPDLNKQDNPQTLDLPRGRTQDDPADTQY